MRAELRAALAAAVLAAGAASLRAATPQAQSITVDDTKVEVSVDAPWPKGLNKGWYPLIVEIANGDEADHRVHLRADAWYVGREIEASVDVAAGATERVELLCPVFAGASNAVSLRVEFDGKRQHFGSSLGAEDAVGPRTNAILVVARDLQPAGTAERWTSETSSGVAPAEHFVHRDMVRHMGSPTTWVTTAPASPSGTPDNIRVAAVRFDQLPSRSEAYSSLDVVVLDCEQGLPDAQRLAPLLAWTRLGGTLLLVGSRPEEAARAIPDLAAWMEKRFADRSGDAHRGAGRPVVGWRFGLGAFFCAAGPALEEPAHRDFVRELVQAKRGIVDDPDGARMQDRIPVIPELFALPLKAFALFLIVFAAVIGPVNFVLVRRKRPALLLLTIPAIALASALLLFLIGVVTQGLGISVATRTLAVLDQREHRVSSAEVRMVFAGLSPGRWLAPKPGSSCYALSTYEGGQYTPAVDQDRSTRDFMVDQSEGLRLAGQFIPPRTAFVQQILAEHAERARIGLHREGGDGGKLVLENGLGAELVDLVLRDAAGGWHKLEGRLADGARAALAPLAADEGLSAARDLRPDVLLPGIHGLAPATWIAELARNPFADDCGIAGEEVAGTHHVLGILGADELGPSIAVPGAASAGGEERR